MSAEGRSFWPSLALVAVCVVATASAGLPVAQIGELTVPADSLAVIWDPDSVDPIRQSVLKDLQDVLETTATGWPVTQTIRTSTAPRSRQIR